MANSMGITGYDYVEFYVGSAKMAAYWHVNALGMNLTGYCGSETGIKDRVSYYLTQNNLKFVITSVVKPSTHKISHFVSSHGGGVKRWAVNVDNVEDSFTKAVTNGAIPVSVPEKLEDEHGYVEEAALQIYDDTELMLVNNKHYKGLFRPGFQKYQGGIECHHKNPGLQSIDHIVGNVRQNEMNRWVDYFNKTMDFETSLSFGPGDISTKYSALLSTVVQTKDGIIKNPINEPYEGIKISQIEEYVREYEGTGIQHIALATEDIIASVRSLRYNGIEFLEIPDAYYDQLTQRNEALPEDQKIMEDIEELREFGVLCDLEGKGYLLQLFTKPIGDRPTFFFEVIERKRGAQGFGQGNFQALFDSIEREQARRGNLDRN